MAEPAIDASIAFAFMGRSNKALSTVFSRRESSNGGDGATLEEEIEKQSKHFSLKCVMQTFVFNQQIFKQIPQVDNDFLLNDW